jgi:putative pyruvate formate lyase activating enzyme
MSKGETRREFISKSLLLSAAALTAGTGAVACEGCVRKVVPKPVSFKGSVAKSKTANGERGSMTFEPAYLALHRSGELEKRGKALWQRMKSCDLCPRQCGADRLSGERGFCGASKALEISSYHPHFGEEDPLVGKGGSGTIFFSNCNLRCVFCINWEISQGGQGRSRTIDSLLGMMMELERIGCLNINTVTPTHYLPHILVALDLAAERGLRLPVVYNTCGYERLEILKVLDGVVDIYLPDFKYAEGEMADKYSRGAADYPEITKAALKEMHRQVGVARPDDNGRMYRGLMVRHLVMPNGVSGTDKVLTWISENLPQNTYINLMSQYRPMFEAEKHPQIARRITNDEYDAAVKKANALGLTNVEIQGYPRSFF